MSWSSFLAIIVMNLVGAASPGPDVILVTRYATKSRRHAIAAAAGIQVGVLMWCTLTVFGAAALLSTFPSVLGFVQAIGGAFLVWMGWKTMRAGLQERRNPPQSLDDAVQRLGRMRQAFRLGLATNLSNPKIVLFLAAMIAPLLPAHPSPGLSVALVLSLSLSSFLLFVALSCVISTNAVRRKLLAAGPWIDIAAGAFFLVAGVLLAVNGLREILFP